jgi:hypothetical protein
MLVWNYIILVFWVERLVVRWYIDFIVWELVLTELLEEICVSRSIEVDVIVIGVFRLVPSVEQP